MTDDVPAPPPRLPRPPLQWIADTTRQLYCAYAAAEWAHERDHPDAERGLSSRDLIEISVDEAWELWDAAAKSWDESAEYYYDRE